MQEKKKKKQVVVVGCGCRHGWAAWPAVGAALASPEAALALSPV